MRGEEQQRVQDASLFPVYHGSAKKWPWHSTVDGCGDRAVPTDWGTGGAPPYAAAFSRFEYTDCGQRRVYLRLYSGTLRLRDTVALAGREKLKITEMRIPSKGEIVRTDTAYQGEIVILPSDSVRLNDVLGDPTRLPRKRWREDPLPMLRTTIAPKTAAQRERLLDALVRNLRILTRFCVAKWIPSPMRSFFLFWAGCSWRLFPLCCRKNTSLKQW